MICSVEHIGIETGIAFAHFFHLICVRKSPNELGVASIPRIYKSAPKSLRENMLARTLMNRIIVSFYCLWWWYYLQRWYYYIHKEDNLHRRQIKMHPQEGLTKPAWMKKLRRSYLFFNKRKITLFRNMTYKELFLVFGKVQSYDSFYFFSPSHSPLLFVLNYSSFFSC